MVRLRGDGCRRADQGNLIVSGVMTQRSINVSFEFFPPNTVEMEKTLWNSIRHLGALEPSFVSVTYGADGSTRKRTHAAVSRIQSETDLTAAPHLTCIGARRGEIDDIARRYWDMDGVTSLRYVAIRRNRRKATFRTRTDMPMRRIWSAA